LTTREIADLVATKALRMEALEAESSVLFPGARNAIARMAAACPTAIASGAIRAEIVRVLEREGLLGFFRAIVAAEDTPRSKPAPDPYLRVVELLSEAVGAHFQPSECAAVEDSRWGLESARAAGLHTIGITHTYSAELLTDAEVLIDHLDRLTPDLLAAL
jgi:HAD superfamily hydrolase (TIGR01509 family)